MSRIGRSSTIEGHALSDGQLARLRVDKMCSSQSVPQFGIGLLAEGINVGTDRSAEQDSLLRDDRQGTAKIIEPNRGDVDCCKGTACYVRV